MCDYLDAIAGSSITAHENVDREARGVSISFKDVQDYLPTFSGTEDVSAWVVEFETSSKLFKWRDLHKLVYAKRVLVGAAKAFVKSIPEVCSWDELKCALVDEFEEKVSSASVHESLRKRKKNAEETYAEYIYAMCELGKKGHVDEESLCEYVVQGIDDKPSNKACLIGTKTVKELKSQIKTYEKLTALIREQQSKRPGTAKNPEGNKQQTPTVSVKCRKCGKTGHFAKDCPNKADGPVCFGCGKPGHRARECSEKFSASGNANLISGDKGGTVTMKIVEKELITLFDTGSQYNLLSEGAQKAIGCLSVTPTEMWFNGFGGKRTAALGTVKSKVTINNDDYPEIEFYIVPTCSMSYNAVLGREALKVMDATVTQHGIEIRPKKNKEEERDSDVFVCETDQITVPPKFREEIASVVNQYEETRCEDNCPESPVKLTIVPNERMIPFRHSPSRLAYPEEKAVDEQVEEWRVKGIVRNSSSDFASRVVVVKKKDGSNCVCVDFGKLNSMILKDGFPIPIIDDVLQKLQVFMRFVNFVFRKFVNNYAQIARPLTNLLRNGVEFKMEKQELDAFEQLKQVLASEPVLRLYQREAKTELHTDASKEGYGAVLLQRYDALKY
ncbi:uncharacterized protein LOC128718332 [Anopheles marshallii]|uniref:uncharacterized protein LOC128718332 n=1 Tax=Anopheles marshallii TaxID=1521116 RepID=UPI00237BB244|nr:uncharacterized protein LOC128718332 [Anopheles marshallii]